MTSENGQKGAHSLGTVLSVTENSSRPRIPEHSSMLHPTHSPSRASHTMTSRS